MDQFYSSAFWNQGAARAMRLVPAVFLLLTDVASLAGDDLNPVTFHRSLRHKPILLVADGQPQGEIVACQSGPLTAAAIRDLQSLIRASTGAELPIVAQRTGIPAIIVSDHPPAAALERAGETLPVEGFAIRTTTNAVLLVGHDDAGTAWAINEFLERFVGVRWYWPEERGSDQLLGTSILRIKNLAISPVFLTDAPVFRKRVPWPSGGPRIGNALMTDHDRRLRCYSSWPNEIIVHAPHNWAATYRESRPAIFQLRADGQRDFEMLCYGNPQTLQTYLEEIEWQREELRKGKAIPSGRRIVNGTAITVSPNDMAVACRCPACRALWNEDGGTYGTASRVLGTFVAALGREVKKRWPEMTVMFLPYKNYTYAPQEVEFPANVEVQICGMPGLALYKDPVINAVEQANIDAWVKLTGRKIQNWHYSCWPEDQTKAAYLFPRTIQSHYRANREKTVGTFINGEENHWPRQHVSLYVWLKCLWNPDFNVEAAIDAYCRRMYGPAAKPMRRLVGMLLDGWERREWPGHALSPKAVYEISYPRKEVVRLEQLLTEAFQRAAGDRLVTARLAYYAGPLRAFFAESKNYAEGTGLTPLIVWQAPEDPRIDGKLDEDCWKGIEPVTFVRALDPERRQPEFPTELRAVWTRRGVTFAFDLREPEPAKLQRDIGADGRDAALMWWNDNVELFLDVTGQRTGYYQFIINPNGALYDARGTDTSWNSEGVKAHIAVGADRWTVEAFVPVAAFPDATPPRTGTVWYGNFTRHRVTDRTQREYQRLNTTYAAPSNDQNAFGPIRFVER